MIFDQNLLFYFTGSGGFTAGNYVNLATVTASTGSSVINLGNPRDLGRGQGEGTPQVAVIVGTGITSACASLTINAQFQGSTDSTNWTTYAERGALSTASFQAGYYVFPQSVPRVPSGVALPTYYRMNLVLAGNGSSETISAGTLIGGIVLDRAENNTGDYSSGFVVN